jgi:protein O-mannosyl-transferase
MRDRGERAKASSGRFAARPPSRAQSERIKSGIVCIFLATIVWIVFGQTLRHDFINYDDNEYITENVHVLNGLNWPDVKWAFTTGHTGYAHPVTWLTHQFDYQLYGAWAGGHHLTSLVIHTVNSLLLFFLFWRMTRDLWPSAFIAALFAIHPLHVESVAWVAERKDVLSGLFFLLTLHAYVAYAAKPEAWRYLLALCLFVLGILSKPMLVTVPCLLLLLDYWPLRRMTFPASKGDPPGRFSLGRLILEKVPFALIAAVWSLLTFAFQSTTGVVAKAHLGFAHRMANAVVSYTMYVWNTFWPEDLALFYPYPRTLPSGAVMVSAALLVLILVLCIAKRRSSPYLMIGWLWFLGMLVPVIGFVQVGEQSRADRYTYLPQIGLCLLATWGTLELFAQWRRGRQVLAVMALVIITGLTTLSHLQASYWQNSETLWHHSLAVTSDNHIAENNLGNELMKKGQLDEAVVHLRKALAIFADYPEAHNNLGYALANKGNWAESITSYRAAVRIRPNYPKAHNNLAISLAELGKTDEALAEFREALRIDRDYQEAHCNLAIVLLRLGRRDEAVAHLREALRLKPDDAEVKAQLRQLGIER